jgi:hypothetical protein
MQLERKPDFEKVQQRFEAWWHCEIIDRPLVSINVKEPHERHLKFPPEKKYATLRDRWFDLEHQLQSMNVWTVHDPGETLVGVGETYPLFFPNLGPEITATLFGCELDFGDHTSWSKPNCENIREVLKLKPNLDTPYWNAIRKATDLSLKIGKGKWITALPDLHTNGDLLASLRDPQNLCLDLMDDPEGVRLACEHITEFYQLIYDDLYNRIAAAGQAATTWINCLHAGRYYVSNCDFICMISPRQFQEAILPSIIKENEFLDRNIFHLDGPGALKHLDALLDVGKLDGVQWVYGAGNGPSAKWAHVYQKVQAAGKCLQILCDDVADAKALAPHIKPQGAWFCPGGSYTPEEANDFIRWIERWAAGKK